DRYRPPPPVVSVRSCPLRHAPDSGSDRVPARRRRGGQLTTHLSDEVDLDRADRDPDRVADRPRWRAAVADDRNSVHPEEWCAAVLRVIERGIDLAQIELLARTFQLPLQEAGEIGRDRLVELE